MHRASTSKHTILDPPQYFGFNGLVPSHVANNVPNCVPNVFPCGPA